MSYNVRHWRKYNYVLKNLRAESVKVGNSILILKDKYDISDESAMQIIKDIHEFDNKLLSYKDGIIYSDNSVKKFLSYGGFLPYFLWSRTKNFFIISSFIVSLFSLHASYRKATNYQPEIDSLNINLLRHTMQIEKIKKQLQVDSLR